MMRLLILLLIGHLTPSWAVTREYNLVNLKKNWTEAQRYCKDGLNDLATIETEEEWAKIKELVTNSGQSNVWIGFYEDINSWRWSLDNTYLNEKTNPTLGSWFQFFWNPTETRKLCTSIWNGKIWDGDCTTGFKFVCYDEPSHTYHPISLLTDWHSAQTHCRASYTDLASMRTQQEMYDIYNQTGYDSGSWWIGLFRNSWNWSDGTNSTFTKWSPSNPSDGTANCVSAQVVGWDDSSCGDQYPFICSGITRKVFRVVVKTDVFMDLNDPHIQDALLKQVEKRLENQGVHQYFKLSWRKQLNGKVFNDLESQPLTLSNP